MKVHSVDIAWHPDLPIYASDRFLAAVGEEFGWLRGTSDSGEPLCLIPYTIVKKPGFRMVRFRTATIPLAGALDEAQERDFLNRVVKYFRSTGADFILPGSNNTIFKASPDGAQAAPYGTFIKDLTKPEDAMLAEIHSDHRRNIRQAEKAGVQVKHGPEYARVAYDMVAETLARSSMKLRGYEDYTKILTALGENVKIFVAEREGTVVAAMVSPFSKYGAYDWYSGTIAEPVRGARPLLLWQAMRTFREMGVRQFDFTGVRINPEKGSKQEGLSNFKMRFGGQLVQGYMWKYSFQPLKFAAYSMAMRWLRGGDVVDLEGHKLQRQ